MGSPGLVATWRFTTSKNDKFTGYINYMNRKEATRNDHFKDWSLTQYDGYNQYMADPKKTTGLFTSTKDTLNSKERKDLKQQFITAQQNGSIMWQTVVSFDTKFLIENHLYDPETHELDQPKLQSAIRLSMTKILEKEGLGNTAVWSAAIHLNTNHIHVHIATVEPKPTRKEKQLIDEKTGDIVTERTGYFKQRNLSQFKSDIANSIIHRDQSLARLSTLIRDQLPLHTLPWGKYKDEQLLRLYKEIKENLPDDTRKWKYNMNAMKDVRPLLDAFSARYMQQYQGDSLKVFDKALLTETKFREALYGTGQENKEKNRAYDFHNNKYDELFAKMGNSILNEMKENNKQTSHFLEEKTAAYQKSESTSPVGIISSLATLKQLLRGDFRNRVLAKHAHDRAEEERESERTNQSHDYERGL